MIKHKMFFTLCRLTGLWCQDANLGSLQKCLLRITAFNLTSKVPHRSVNNNIGSGCHRQRPCHWAALWCVERGIVIVFSSRHIVQIIVNSKYICTFLLCQSVTTQHPNLVWSAGLNTVCSQTYYVLFHRGWILDIQLNVVLKNCWIPGVE